MQKFMEKFHEKIAELIYDENWAWLHLLISVLCDLEMGIKFLMDKELRHLVKTSDTVYEVDGQRKTIAEVVIPENTFYCDCCPYRDISEIAKIFFGEQCYGYCHYLGKGDYSFKKPTSILWDCCKECGINEQVEED